VGERGREGRRDGKRERGGGSKLLSYQRAAMLMEMQNLLSKRRDFELQSRHAFLQLAARAHEREGVQCREPPCREPADGDGTCRNACRERACRAAGALPAASPGPGQVPGLSGNGRRRLCGRRRACWLAQRPLRNEVATRPARQPRRGRRWRLAGGPCAAGTYPGRVQAERATSARQTPQRRRTRRPAYWARRQAPGRPVPPARQAVGAPARAVACVRLPRAGG
jgi:hypothetical protein